MLASSFLDFKRQLDGKGIIFSFSGYVSEGILFALGDALRQKMALDETDASTIKKVFAIFVEQVQNIIRYSAEKLPGHNGSGPGGHNGSGPASPPAAPGSLSSGMIAIGTEGPSFFVVCANTVLIDDVPKLKERLEHLRNLDKEGLRAYYKQKLREPPEDDSQGATIGLIEIARHASQPIQFDFTPAEAGQAFFCLRALI